MFSAVINHSVLWQCYGASTKQRDPAVKSETPDEKSAKHEDKSRATASGFLSPYNFSDLSAGCFSLTLNCKDSFFPFFFFFFFLLPYGVQLQHCKDSGIFSARWVILVFPQST